MTRIRKLTERFLSKPRDFSFDEIRRLLNGLGYAEVLTGKTGGSRVAFFDEKRMHVIRLHKPHPPNTVKRYLLAYLEDELRKAGVL